MQPFIFFRLFLLEGQLSLFRTGHTILVSLVVGREYISSPVSGHDLLTAISSKVSEWDIPSAATKGVSSRRRRREGMQLPLLVV